jgi:thioester reductase-like protein
LRELLVETTASVHCLVRAANQTEGQRRLESTLAEWGLWEERFGERIVAVPGDLSRPQLGLTDAVFNDLAERLDAIHHNGALVNFMAQYGAMKATNVDGTLEAIRLACRRRTKALHLVSSLAVVPLTNFMGAGILPELDDLDPQWPVQGGYVQSKWVGEKLVHAARDRGLPVTIYRPSVISGHSRTGVCHLEDMFCRMIKGCVQATLTPAIDFYYDLTPVDYVAAALVHLSRRPESLGHAFYLINPEAVAWSETLAVLGAHGYPVSEVPYTIWQSFLARQAAGQTEQNSLAMLAPLFPAAGDMPECLPRIRCDQTRTVAGLAGTGIVCPPADAALVSKYVTYLMGCGFLPRSQRTLVLQP